MSLRRIWPYSQKTSGRLSCSNPRPASWRRSKNTQPREPRSIPNMKYATPCLWDCLTCLQPRTPPSQRKGRRAAICRCSRTATDTAHLVAESLRSGCVGPGPSSPVSVSAPKNKKSLQAWLAGVIPASPNLQIQSG